MAGVGDEKHQVEREVSPHAMHSDPEKNSGRSDDPNVQRLAGEITYADEEDPVNRQHNPLAQKLQSRHMQMIAIGE